MKFLFCAGSVQKQRFGAVGTATLLLDIFQAEIAFGTVINTNLDGNTIGNSLLAKCESIS